MSCDAAPADTFRPLQFVAAAGHKLIPAPKSGKSYPAFLIRLPNFPLGADIAPTKLAGSSPSSTYTYRWRTKRDLLLLSRSAKMSASYLNEMTKQQIEFPKATYSKLADAAARCPWIRPTEGDDSSSTLCDFRGNNGWEPRLIKSVRRLDDFLQECKRLYVEIVDSDFGNHDAARQIIQGWQQFCQGKDTNGLIDYENNKDDEKTNGSSANKKRALDGDAITDLLPVDSTKRAARLGQYFASEDNAAAVVDRALSLVETGDNCMRNVIFVEPSCGDGRIIECLLQRCADSNTIADRLLCILGYDIDGRAIKICQDKICGAGSLELPGDFAVVFRQTDFLSLTREELINDVIGAVNKRDEETARNQIEPLRLTFLGGPPYSLGPLGDGPIGTTERGLDLPQHFIQKCILDLQGEAISFLLPERCANEKEVEDMVNKLPHGWKSQSTPVKENVFDFRGKMVTQPSIVQSWNMEET